MRINYSTILFCSFMLLQNLTAQTLPDLSVQLMDVVLETPQPNIPQNPHTVSLRVRRIISGYLLDVNDTHIFQLRGYISSDNILSSDDLLVARQDLWSSVISSNLDQIFGIEYTPTTIGKNYIIFKIDADNVINESNESNNVSNALPLNAYALTGHSNANAPWNEWISNVQFKTINNTSGKMRYGVTPLVTRKLYILN
jgi:CARDB